MRLLASPYLSVRLYARNNWRMAKHIFLKFFRLVRSLNTIYRQCSSFSSHLATIMGTSHEDLRGESPASRATTWGALPDDVITQPDRRQPTLAATDPKTTLTSLAPFAKFKVQILASAPTCFPYQWRSKNVIFLNFGSNISFWNISNWQSRSVMRL
jgi:hypothetical protein